MRSVYALLAIYSELDRLALANPELEEVIDRFLPGTAGHAGWSEEIRRFLSDPDHPLDPWPSLPEAINLFVEEGSEEPETSVKPTTASELSRLAYAIGVLSRVQTDTTLFEESLKKGLRLVVPQGQDEEEKAENLLELMRHSLRERDDWPVVMYQAKLEGWINDLVGQIPLCRPRLKDAHGHRCVVLDTEFSSNAASLDELKNVIDPLNWHLCLPFFCNMIDLPHPVRADGWGRVLEVCNTNCPYPPDMKTPLKYWKGPRSLQAASLEPPTAWVNYELDDTPVSPYPGDGRVLVDEGFIKMYSTSGDPATDGVRVVTKKVVCFRDLSEVAIAILACVSGYANQGMDMMLNGVARRHHDPTGFTDWMPSDDASGSTSMIPPTDTPSSPTDIGIPTDPNRPSRRAITLAIQMANECLDDFTKKSSAVADKVVAGSVPIPEMIALNTEFMTRLATDPWRYWERLRDETRKGGK